MKYPKESLLGIIERYDADQRTYISELEEKNISLAKENFSLVAQNVAHAEANSRALLKNIVDGVYDNLTPCNSKEKLLQRMKSLLASYREECGGTCLQVHLFLGDGKELRWNGSDLVPHKDY